MLAAFVLADYELNLDQQLADPEPSAQLAATDFSGVAYSTDTNSFFVVDDDAGEDAGNGPIKGLYEYSLDGTFQRAITLVGFNSPESIVHLNDDSFAIMEEADFGSPATKEITLVTITAATTTINKSNQSTTVLTGPQQLFEGGANDGPEGLAYDPNGGPNGDGVFYVAKEKDNPRLFEVILDQNMNATAVNEIVVPGITGSPQFDDLSDIFFADGDLFAVSDQAQRIFRIDLATNTVIGSDINLPQRKFEGLSFTPDGFQMFVVSDKGNGATPRRYQQYRNFTVFNPTLPDLASGSDLGVSTIDDVTNDTTPTFTGTVPADSTVWIYVDGVQAGNPDPLTGGASAYSITLPAIADGSYAITIKVGESTSTPESKRSPASPALNITIDTAAPRIDQVIFSGSGSVHAPFSLDAQNPDIGTGGQLKTIPVGSADRIQIGFTEDIGIAAGAGQTLKQQVSLDGIIFGTTNDQSGSSATLDTTVPDAPIWTFPNIFGADQYILSVRDAIIDIAGNQLDGEWTNPDTVYDGTSPAKNATVTISTFPSGTGVAGGNFDFRFVILPGDANRDNVVGVADATIMDTFGPETSSATDSTFQQGDIDGDGDITNAVDYATLIDPNVFGTVLVAWNLQLLLGDLDIDLDVDFDDIDDFVAAINIAFSDYLDTHRGSFNGYDDTVITQIVEEAIGDIDDDGDLDFDDIDDFVALLKGISGSNGQLLPPALT